LCATLAYQSIFVQVPAKKQKVEESVLEVDNQNGDKDDCDTNDADTTQNADDTNEETGKDKVKIKIEQMILYLLFDYLLRFSGLSPTICSSHRPCFFLAIKTCFESLSRRY